MSPSLLQYLVLKKQIEEELQSLVKLHKSKPSELTLLRIYQLIGIAKSNNKKYRNDYKKVQKKIERYTNSVMHNIEEAEEFIISSESFLDDIMHTLRRKDNIVLDIDTEEEQQTNSNAQDCDDDDDYNGPPHGESDCIYISNSLPSIPMHTPFDDIKQKTLMKETAG